MRKAIFYLAIFLSLIATNTEYVWAAATDILISEIMYDLEGADKGHEWLEFYNSGSDSVTIVTGSSQSAWRFWDGAKHTLKLAQGTTTIATDSYFVLADKAEQFIEDYPEFSGILFDTVMSLKNTSSTVALSTDGGKSYFLETTYNSDWGASGNGYSLAKQDLSGSDGASNWRESQTVGGSPGISNSTSTDSGEEEDEDDDDETDDDQIDDNSGGGGGFVDPALYWRNIIISEFLPNPDGSDDGEWIELYNKGPIDINLDGFAIQDNSTRIFKFNEESNISLNLASNSYLLLTKAITKISLNNTGGDSVKLYNPDGQLQEVVIYSDKALADRSYARDGNFFTWTAKPSPKQANVFIDNQAPVAEISRPEGNINVGDELVLSAQDSYDPEGGRLKYKWDFGDDSSGDEVNENHVYREPGVYKINLTVTDAQGLSDQTSRIIEVREQATEVLVADIKPIDFSLDDLIISEFIANPFGSDEAEWIELYNSSAGDIDLLGWQLDDGDGGSRPYTFSSSTPILAGQFLVVERERSRIALNNSDDSVRLLTPLAELWQEVLYDKSVEGQSQAWDLANQEWFTAEPSPGLANVAAIKVEPIYFVSEITDLAKGSQITIQGVALNSVDGDDRSLYLAHYDGHLADLAELVEIYSHKKQLPEIKVGTVLTVSGQLSRVGNLARLKIAKATDVLTNDSFIDLAQSEILLVEDIDEEMIGDYIQVKGIVVKKSGKNIYLAADVDDEYSLRVYSRFATKELGIKKGQELIATGILSETDSGLRLSPFTVTDLQVSQAVKGVQIGDKDKNKKNSAGQTIELIINEASSRNIKLIAYGFLLSIIIVVIYFYKKRAHS